MLLEVLTDKIVIDSTFSRLFGKSESSGVDWDWGMKLLKRKQLPEIRKRLTDTLGRDRILMDVSIDEQQNWVNRSPLAADRILQINGEDCGTLDANKMLIETFGRDDIEGKLLILGAPGAGKTTALLSLAEQLVYGAIYQPKTVIPVIFELSTWQNDNQSIQSWLIEQLYDLHGGNRKSKLYEQWLERQVLLPLLDGLDELGLERQKKCTEKLNEFAEHYPQLVICCRVKEFEAADIKLRNLRGAVCLQSLSDSQIQDYLDSLKRPELWEAIQTTPSLQAMLEPTTEGDPGLLRVPLFVKLVADVYDPQQPISSKADLLDKYIDRQLSFDKREIDRRKELDKFKWAYKTVKQEPDWKQIRSHLRWLAQNLQTNHKIELSIEKIQPSWIKSARSEKYYILLFWLLFVVIFTIIHRCLFGFTFGVIFEMTFELINIVALIIEISWKGASVRILNLLFYLFDVGDLSRIDPLEAFKMPTSIIARQSMIRNFKIGFKKGFIVGLLFGLLFGLLVGIIADTGSVNPLPNIVIGVIVALIAGIILGLILGMIVGSILGVIGGVRQDLKMRFRPNQGVWQSLRNQMLITIVIFLVAILIEEYRTAIYHASLIGFVVGGGKAVLQHISLRIVLWQSGLPLNFKQFLNYCVERRLLLRVGGSYRFLHQELLDHFSQSNH
jgi:NACHT domain